MYSLENPKGCFAADVMCHKNCIKGYALKFKQYIEFIKINSGGIEDKYTETGIKDVLMSMSLTTSAYYKSPGKYYDKILVKHTS